MELESTYDDIIVRYLLQEATEEEEAFVLDWMKADEKNRMYVEGLKNTLQLISMEQELPQIDVEQEWDRFRQEISEDQQNTSSFYDGETDEGVTIAEKPGRKATIYKIVITVAVAASIMLIMGLGWGWFNHPADDHTKGLQARKSDKGANTNSLTTNSWHEMNTSGAIKRFTLPDGSEIVLDNNSELTYQEPVIGNRRDVYLKGTADFKVAKDKTKPFTVYSGDITTTAIGTVFTVSSLESEKYISVKLEEGKVVVRLLKPSGTNQGKEYYLSPSQELIYDKEALTAKIRPFNIKKRINSNINNQMEDNPSIPKYNKSSWFMFNNQPLGEIFDALGDMYKVRIVYTKRDIKNKYFIGTFDRSESLETILKKIAVLNDLTVTKEKDTFRIRRIH